MPDIVLDSRYTVGCMSVVEIVAVLDPIAASRWLRSLRMARIALPTHLQFTHAGQHADPSLKRN